MLRSPNECLLRHGAENIDIGPKILEGSDESQFNLTSPDSRLQPDIWKLSEIPWVNEDFFVLALLFEKAKSLMLLLQELLSFGIAKTL
ncbi:hypothetical protein CDAR_526081 [Caerostris darwini]|uniref:Uncharacterized protein n=1 Tax=Caerostris darwini TaxID=1538125 RepID=A0AAV4UHU6_9ARAC|nr:hypothetical protein CDAR_526081 [Caerostris darwini]